MGYQRFFKISQAWEANVILLSDFLQEYFKIADDIITTYKGFRDKFIGDGVMAIFGLNGPEDISLPAIDAIRAAIEFRDKFDMIISKWIEKWGKYVPEFEAEQWD